MALLVALSGAGLSCAPADMSFVSSLRGLSDAEIAKVTNFDERSILAFQAKVHHILRRHCGTCHSASSGVPGSAKPHSDPDVRLAYSTLTTNHYVDFTHPGSSHLIRVIQRREGAHPLLLPEAIQSVGPEMLAGISAWGTLRGPDPNEVRRTADYELALISTMTPPSPLATTIPAGTISLGEIMEPAPSGSSTPSLGFKVENFHGLYRISDIRIRNPVDPQGPHLRVKNMSVHLNGQLVTSASGFRRLDVDVPHSSGALNQNTYSTLVTTAQQSVLLIPSCGSGSPQECRDRISFSFEILAYL